MPVSHEHTIVAEIQIINISSFMSVTQAETDVKEVLLIMCGRPWTIEEVSLAQAHLQDRCPQVWFKPVNGLLPCQVFKSLRGLLLRRQLAELNLLRSNNWDFSSEICNSSWKEKGGARPDLSNRWSWALRWLLTKQSETPKKVILMLTPPLRPWKKKSHDKPLWQLQYSGSKAVSCTDLAKSTKMW